MQHRGHNEQFSCRVLSWHIGCDDHWENLSCTCWRGVEHAPLINIVSLQGLDTLREHESFKSAAESQPEAVGRLKRLPVDLSQLSLQDTNEEEVGIIYLCLARHTALIGAPCVDHAHVTTAGSWLLQTQGAPCLAQPMCSPSLRAHNKTLLFMCRWPTC